MRSDAAKTIRLKNYKPADYSVKSVDLLFKLDPIATHVCATLQVVRAKTIEAGTKLNFEGDGAKLIRVAIDGRTLEPADYIATPDNLEISNLPRKRSFELTVETEVNPSANTNLMGLYLSSEKYCTQCEAEGFRRITYFPDRPDVLAVYTTRIEADRDSVPILLGNGNLVKKGKLSGNRHFAVWHDPHPKPSYLFALVAGDFGSIHQNFKTASGEKVRLGVYVERGKEPHANYAMDALIRSMRWDEEVFGCEYDLKIFNIVAVSDFNMGAMENKGLNVFNDKYILADPDTATDTDYENIEAIIAHEYFHNWTGNRITCRDWFQLCLKEGLTVYRDQEFSSDMRSRENQRITQIRRLRGSQFIEDSGPLAHPVRPESYREINNFYTATVYEKGAELVRMLATILGAKQFSKGIRLYLRRHDGDATTIEAFLKCFSDATKVDLSQFFLWYSQAGTPNIIASSNYDGARQRLDLEIEQSIAPTPGQARKKMMHIPLRIGLVGRDGADISSPKITGCDNNGDVFHITKRRQKIVFHDVAQKPVLSINRGFSAPINLELHQTKTDLAFLATNDSDPFNRWQAFQNYATQLLINATRLLGRAKAPKFDPKFFAAAAAIAHDETLSPAFRALCLNLPSEGELAQLIGRSINPQNIHNARNALRVELGAHLVLLWKQLWNETEITEDYLPNADQSGKRALRNIILDLGVIANDDVAEKASLRQFKNADNMSDRYAAFCRIIHHHGSAPESEKAIAHFYERYHDNPLVLDKWFIAQAMGGGKTAPRNIRALMRHEKFTMKNPNRVRAVLGTFAFANPTGFNAASGDGYSILIRAIGALDKTNPQVAARMMTAFRSFNQLESGRKKLAHGALKKLRENQDLSTDVSEILDRTLG